MFMTTSFFLVLKSAISILIVLGIFLTLDSTIFLITLLLIPINIFSYLFINKTLNQRIKTMQDENANAQKDLILLLGNPEQFKMLTSFDTVKQLTSKHSKKCTQVWQEQINLLKSLVILSHSSTNFLKILFL